jgi:carbonic anhydrase
MKKNLRIQSLVSAVALTTLLACGSAFASSDGHGAAASASAMTVTETIKAAITGNDEFKGHHDSHYFDAYQSGQTPNLTVVTCSDSRVHTKLFDLDPHNNIFVIRNIGNQVKNSEGSVDYGVRHLPTKILLVLGHSSCGAVKAAMGDYSGETSGIKAELDSLLPVIQSDTSSDSFDLRWAKNVERNVDHQVSYALQLYKEKIDAGEMAVVGGVYDFNDLYGKGRGSLIITNINGETSPNKIMQHQVLKELTDAELVTHVSSLAP